MIIPTWCKKRRALINYARGARGASEFWAGGRHANLESVRMVERLGFSVYEALPDRKRYRWIPGVLDGEA